MLCAMVWIDLGLVEGIPDILQFLVVSSVVGAGLVSGWNGLGRSFSPVCEVSRYHWHFSMVLPGRDGNLAGMGWEVLLPYV